MAMKVFEKAEACYAKMARPSTSLAGKWGNPDLRLSRGLARRHVEDYAGAIDDFREAHKLDPSLNAGDMAEDLSELSFYAFWRQYAVVAGRLVRKRCERMVAVNGTGWPGEAATSHAHHAQAVSPKFVVEPL